MAKSESFWKLVAKRMKNTKLHTKTRNQNVSKIFNRYENPLSVRLGEKGKRQQMKERFKHTQNNGIEANNKDC